MGDIITFRRDGTRQRTWVPADEEEWWLNFWGKQGVPAARWRDYRRWGGFWPPLTESASEIMLRPLPRRGRG